MEEIEIPKQKEKKIFTKNQFLKFREGRNFGKDISNGINFINKNNNNKTLDNNILKNYSSINNHNNTDGNNQNNLKENKIQKIIGYNKKCNQRGSKFDKIKEKPEPIKEYDEEIMKNLFLDEIKNRADYKVLSEIISEKENNFRISCINSFIFICEKFRLRQETFYLAINLFDRYLQYLKTSKILDINNIKLIILSCIFIASKYEEIYPPYLEDYSKYFFFREEEIFKIEYNILNVTNFELHICSPYLFLTKFFNTMEKYETKLILYGGQFILDICLLSIDFCRYKPSLQASISLYLAKFFLIKKEYKIQIWSAENEYITGYSENEIKNYLKIPLKQIKAFFSNNAILKGITNNPLYLKYNSNKYLNVAKILKSTFK